jgi:hypothetical protein
MTGYYANITLYGAPRDEVAQFLAGHGDVAYVAPFNSGGTTGAVVFHQDLGAQERIAIALSKHFRRPAWVVMTFGESILLYELYENGEETDAYVSTPHEGLELDGAAQEGNAKVLCAAFGIEMDHKVNRVERILRTPTKPTGEFAYAANRHGELCKALGLPQFAVGASFASIEMGELPHGQGFAPATMIKTSGS